jgi:hypothetical protein
MSSPEDPYGQPDPYGQQQQGPPSYEQQYPQQGYQYGQQYPQHTGGHAPPKAPRKPIDLATLVTIGGWVVMGLFALAFLYGLTQDDEFGGDFADRFFGGLQSLGLGIFYGSVLLAVGVWLRRQQAGAD